MTTDNNKNSQRNKRCTVSFTEEEHKTIFDAAIAKNYSNKAIARYIREELLSSISKADHSPCVIVPSVNQELAKDLRGAVNNLNQSLKVLHQLTITSTQSEQINQAKSMMSTIVKVAHRCKELQDFSKGEGGKNALAKMALETFNKRELEKLVSIKSNMESKQ
ncbi:hypothetical protein [Pseudoalteromonas sp. JC3]|uniref:hypothetical protein n=1 Tax=Pseudoalteromonas sp. JC3 TaxID=2810196 RepID=UPI0019D2C6B7|nr:hypothetical protein [Pseudoalteromonas sp. JC3]MBR8842315.1 hypothetical protein [Pseudoalteromonas sp. JC3]WJE09560.1 hypothetical protein QSH61_03560 [Pseudoalteromonas sp. JC3]